MGRDGGGDAPGAKGVGRRVRRIALVLNAAGFAFFLWWLFTLRDSAILREQEGILYFLPCLPFLFVQLLLTPRGTTPKSAEAAAEGAEKTKDSAGREGRPDGGAGA